MARLLTRPFASVALLLAEPALAANDPGTPSTLPLLLALAAVVGAILVAGFMFKRLGGSALMASRWMRPVAQVSVGTRERVVILELDGKWLVLGVTSGAINLLTTIDPIINQPSQESRGSAFAQLLERVRKPDGKK